MFPLTVRKALCEKTLQRANLRQTLNQSVLGSGGVQAEKRGTSGHRDHPPHSSAFECIKQRRAALNNPVIQASERAVTASIVVAVLVDPEIRGRGKGHRGRRCRC